MKIRSELKAGRTFQDCARERDWWKWQESLMEEYAKSNKTTPPAGLWFPSTATQLPSTPPTATHLPSYPSTKPGTSTGPFYPDMSGYCK